MEGIEYVVKRFSDVYDSLLSHQHDVFNYETRSLRTFVSDRMLKGFEQKQQDIINEIILKVFTYSKAIDNTTKYYSVVLANSQYWILDEYNFNQNYGSIDLGDNMTL